MSLHLLLAFLAVGAANVQAQSLPDDDGMRQNGVASCAGSTCHGAVRPFAESNILHNEFITWTREDKHARAYQVLLNKQSKSIAQKLGLGPPHIESLCLDCHASNVPKDRRGAKFQLSEGVGCEACHGGSEKWLNSHADKKATHADNLKKGMYPTEEPAARTRLCLSCHFGNDKKFVTHRIMGAGHPRLSIEVDTFSALMPPHYKIDADYIKRKGAHSETQTWAVGQLIAVEQYLQQLQKRAAATDSFFPELSLFDCHSCHHRMSDQRWQPRNTAGLGPGVVRLYDANFIMLHALLGAVDQAQADSFKQNLRGLHRATTKDAVSVQAAIATMQAALPALQELIGGHAFNAKETRAILREVVDAGLNNQLIDYAAAEQATMAIGSLLAELDNQKALDAKQQDQVNAQLDVLYKCVENDEDYHPSCFVGALKKLQAAVK